RPANLHIHRHCIAAKPHDDPSVVRGEIASSTRNPANEFSVGGRNRHFRSDRIAVAPGSQKGKPNPVAVLPNVVFQQYGWSIQSHDYNVRIAVIVDVSDGKSASYVLSAESRARNVTHILEIAIAIISEQKSWLFVLHIYAGRLDGLVDMPVCDNQVQISVVVIV